MRNKAVCLNWGYCPDIFLEVLNETTKIQLWWQITWLEFQRRIPRVWTAMFVVRQRACCSFCDPVGSPQINAFITSYVKWKQQLLHWLSGDLSSYFPQCPFCVQIQGYIEQTTISFFPLTSAFAFSIYINHGGWEYN